ncbi:hypothetical protein EI94DRAFT_1088329 [Lactarius quietus]|nr:hypothetical protein EI94DRAFT_1088329 [Lactarius quietus]
MCAKVLDLAKFPQGPAHHLYRTVFRACNRNPRTTTSGPHSHDIRDENHVCAQAIFTAVVSRPRQRDDSWFSQVAPNALGIPEAVLRDYAATGDNLSLAIFIHVIRQQFTYLQYSYWPKYDFWDVLERISKFDIQKTSPELQHEFCELWNQIVLKAQNDDNRDITRWILRQIRDIYITLHRDTDSAPKLFSATTSGWANILDAPSSYPVCEIPGHVHDNSASTTFSRTVLHNVPAQVPASLSGLNAPSLSVPALRHAAESSADVPSSDPSHSVQTTIDPRIPVTSADLFTASVRDVDTSGITTMPHPSPEISTSAPLYSGLPPAAVALRHNANPLAPSGLLNSHLQLLLIWFSAICFPQNLILQ